MWWIPVQWNQNTTLLPQPYITPHSHCNITTTGEKPSTTRKQLQWDPSGMNPSKISFAGTLHFWSLKLKHTHTHTHARMCTHTHTHTHTHVLTHTYTHTHTHVRKHTHTHMRTHEITVRAPEQCYLQEWKIEGLRAMPLQNMFCVTPTGRSKQKPKIKDFVLKRSLHSVFSFWPNFVNSNSWGWLQTMTSVFWVCMFCTHSLQYWTQKLHAHAAKETRSKRQQVTF